MATRKANRWSRDDVAASRLLDAIGATDLDYYSAADERALTEALQAWPLLASVSRALVIKSAANETGAARPGDAVDPPLRVIDSATPTPPRGEPVDDPGVLAIPKPPTKESRS